MGFKHGHPIEVCVRSEPAQPQEAAQRRAHCWQCTLSSTPSPPLTQLRLEMVTKRFKSQGGTERLLLLGGWAAARTCLWVNYTQKKPQIWEKKDFKQNKNNNNKWQY